MQQCSLISWTQGEADPGADDDKRGCKQQQSEMLTLCEHKVTLPTLELHGGF